MADKRYPRGVITKTDRTAKQVTGELIELKPEGVFYCDVQEDNTIFVPYTAIREIRYEEVPEELLEKAKEDAGPYTLKADA